MMDSTIRKIIHSRRRNTTAIITKSYSNILTDCDDKTLVILLEELRPLRLVSMLDEELLELLMHSRLSSRYQTGSANPIYASKTTEKLMHN